MAEAKAALSQVIRPGRIGLLAIYLAFCAVVVRSLGMDVSRPLLVRYLLLELSYLVLFTWLFWKLDSPQPLIHFYFVVQSALVLAMFSLRPQFDFVVVLFILLSYQVSLVFSASVRWTWIGILVFLTLAGLIFFQGFWHGLALSMTNIAAEIVIPTYVSVSYDLEMSRARSQALLAELQQKHQQLKAYSEQAEELAVIKERNRLARELHDTVSQLIFSIALSTRSAQMMLTKDPERVPEQLRRLQEMTGEALRQLRSFISQLRPPVKK